MAKLFWKRLLSLFIDLIFLVFIIWVLRLFIPLLELPHLYESFLLYFFDLTFFIFYRLILHYYWGCTLGKKYFGLKVVSFNNYEKTAPLNLLKREMFFIYLSIPSEDIQNALNIEILFYLNDVEFNLIDFLGFLIGITFITLSIIWIFRDKNGRTIHDFLANTVVKEIK